MSLSIQNVTKRYGNVLAVDNITLDAKPGEFVVLLGPSGCGKSTLLRVVAGLEDAESGSITLNGTDITRLEPRDRDLAMVFQSYALYPHMTVRENIAYPLKIRKKPAAEIAAEVAKAAARLELDGLLDRQPKELSGGQRQRVALARAIVRHPRAFLMDEPLSNLDARLRVETRGELKRLQRDLGVVTLYVTHDQSEAMTLAHRIVVMDRGRILQIGTPAEVYSRPADIFVASFVGSPRMNLMPVAGGVIEGVRPEDIEVRPAAESGFTEARVYVVEEMGNETFLILDAPIGRITARVPAGFPTTEDAPIWFRPRLDKIHRFDAATTKSLSS